MIKKYLPTIILSIAFVLLLLFLNTRNSLNFIEEQKIIPTIIPTPTNIPTPTSVAKTEKQLGYIKSAYTKDNKNYIDIDYVQWIEDSTAPNNFRIDNINPLIRTFEVAKTTTISTITYPTSGNMTTLPVSFNQFIELVNKNNILCDIEITGSIATKISQHFAP